MNMYIATKKENTVIESLADGTGIRLVIFTSGCPHHCNGCHNPESWDYKNGVEISVDELATYIKELYSSGSFDGITFSGGDPLFQSDALYELIKDIRNTFPDINIWCYTGYNYETYPHKEILSLIDVLVDGKYDETKKFPKKKFRGSNNQRILYLQNGSIIKEE